MVLSYHTFPRSDGFRRHSCSSAGRGLTSEGNSLIAAHPSTQGLLLVSRSSIQALRDGWCKSAEVQLDSAIEDEEEFGISEDYGTQDTCDVPTQDGAMRASAIRLVWTRQSIFLAYCSIFFISVALSLDRNTVQSFTPYITSNFSAHSQLGTLTIVSGIVWAAGKGIMAKISDVFGRVEAFIFSMSLYSLGCLQMSLSNGIGTFGSATILYVSGTTGIEIIQQIVIADTTELIDRALLSSLPDLPFLFNVWLGPSFAQFFLDKLSWRMGYRFFAIMLPICATPLICVLLYNQYKAKRLGLVNPSSWNRLTTIQIIARLLSELDALGIVLFTGGLVLLLIPMNIAASQPSSWLSSRIIAMVTSGLIMCCTFAIWDIKYAKYPLVSFQMMRDHTIFAGCAAGFFYYMAFYVFSSYFLSFLQVARFHSPAGAGRISEVFSFTAAITTLTVSFIIRLTAQYHYWILLSGPVYITGLFFLSYVWTPSTPIALVVMSQIVLGIGGGMFIIPTQLGIQAVSSAQSVAMVTALFLSSMSLGGSVGAAVASLVWTSMLPGLLKINLPHLDSDTVERIYKDFEFAMSYKYGTEERNAINIAYTIVMRKLCFVAIFSALPMLACICLMKRANLCPTEPRSPIANNPAAGPIETVVRTSGRFSTLSRHARGRSLSASLVKSTPSMTW